MTDHGADPASPRDSPPGSSQDATDAPEQRAAACAACGAGIAADDAFCEACGTPTGVMPSAPAVPSGPTAGSPDGATQTDPATNLPVSTTCRACGAPVEDGYCTVCGVRALTGRDHWEERPAAWLGGVCDRGIVHLENEDAIALSASDDGTFGVMVVCDGVTSAPRSGPAALAAARAACALLAGSPMPLSNTQAGAVSHWHGVMDRAAAAANAEVVGVAHQLGDPAEPPSCTYVAAVVQGGLVHVAWCGDSRAYLIPDHGEPLMLSTDHSLGTQMVAGGMTRSEAEADPQFHTITRWLGADSVDPTPEFTAVKLDGPSWVMLCSDGLWNYASAPAAAAAALRRAITAAGPSHAADPVAIGQAMVDFANSQGGHDNISVVLARCGGPAADQPTRSPDPTT